LGTLGTRYINQELEDFVTVITLMNKERPSSKGARETVDDSSLGRGVSGNIGDLHGDFFRGPAGQGRRSEKRCRQLGSVDKFSHIFTDAAIRVLIIDAT
jgi:hypothetical protein